MSSSFATLDTLAVSGQRVLVRVDVNVPMENGVITDDTRIRKIWPTLKELADKKAKVIVLAHFGRPKGSPSAEFSLKPVADALSVIASGYAVRFAADCVGSVAEQAVSALQPGQILLLENVRFHKEEEKNDAAFAARLAALGDVYVNDAFSAAHRAHASTEALARLLPSAAGRLMQAELEALFSALTTPERPVLAIVGGAKVSTKIDLLNNLVTRVNAVAVGGGMANTFLYALGHDVGKSLCEKDAADTAKAILAKAEASGCTFLLPSDVVVADAFSPAANTLTVPATAIPAERMALDIGRTTIAAWQQFMGTCKTIVWNGPVGAFEMEPFASGTIELARTIANLTSQGKVRSVAGGGDTLAALAKAGVTDELSYVSTAGGAFLEWMEGKELPGVTALYQAKAAA
jgi:phosphoglycerate kinase